MKYSIRLLLMHTAVFAVGLAAGLYWSRGPAWVVYYHQGYRDGFEAGNMPVQRLERENEELRAYLSDR